MASIEAAQALPEAAIGGVGFVDLLHGHQNGLFVGRGKLVRPVIGNLDQGIECAEVEDWGIERRPHRSDPGDRNAGARSWAALRAPGGGDHQARKQVRGPGSDNGDRGG